MDKKLDTLQDSLIRCIRNDKKDDEVIKCRSLVLEVVNGMRRDYHRDLYFYPNTHTPIFSKKYLESRGIFH
jgi:hypothetical protein